MKILINRKPVDGPWGGGNLLVRAMYEILPDMGHQVVDAFHSDIDAIFMHDPRPGNTGISINEILSYKSMKKDTKIINRVNECDARKGTNDIDSLLRQCSEYTDTTIFVSDWIKRYHIDKGWNCENSSVIYNGVNTDHFKESEKIKNGKINIDTHHWSDNAMKGFDVYDHLDRFVKENKEFTFTYIGRHRGTFKNTKIIEPLFGESLGRELSKYDVYISGSRYDPGPNHILESISCNIPTFSHIDGGGACEFSGASHVYRTLDDLISILRLKKYTKNSLTPQTWVDCVEKYEKVFTGEV